MSIHLEDDTLTLHLGDCVEVMAAMPPESVDAIVCDPPYGLEFMGREWDKLDTNGRDDLRHKRRMTEASEPEKGKPWASERPSYGNVKKNPRCRICERLKWATNPCACESPRWDLRQAESARAMQEWHLAWATEALRVLKPGGHMLAFGGTRTFHRLTCAIEDAGFEVRDCLSWLYGSGFPKSLDVSKAIDKAAGAERVVVGRYQHPEGGERTATAGRPDLYGEYQGIDGWHTPITAPATPEAAEWEGWGTSLKPAWEPIVVARKPLQGTVAANVLRHGTGAINVDGCRVAHDGSGVWGNHGQNPAQHIAEPGSNGTTMGTGWARPGSERNPAGRWPANVVLDEAWIPVLRPRATLESDAWELLADWCNARNGDVPRVRGRNRRPAEPGEAEGLLLAGVLRGVAECEPARSGSPDARAQALAGVDGEDQGGGEAQRTEWAAESEVARLVHVAGLSDDRGVGVAGGRAGGLRLDAEPEQRPSSAGTPPGDGASPGATTDARRGSASPQRREVGQPAGEPGATGERLAPDEARRGDSGDAEAAGRGRAPDRRVVEVLLPYVPAEWRDRFEFTGDVARVGAAERLDAEVGERPAGAFPGAADTSSRSVFPGGFTGGRDGERRATDTGGPSRFFYTAKASTAERDGATHPTVKPLALMRWCVRLVTPPGGVVLDPFAGSGTTLIAARDEGFRAVGIEREPEYAAMAAERYRRRYDPAAATWDRGNDADDQLSLLGAA